METKICLIALVLVASSACGGEETTPSTTGAGKDGTAAAAADWASMCTERCSWDQRCATADDPASDNCQANCESDATKPEVYRKDAVEVLQSCFGALGCASSDDTCFGQAILSISADPGTNAGYQSCRARYESCAASAPGSFSDDICSHRLLLTDATQAPLDACLAGACGQVADCIDALLGS